MAIKTYNDQNFVAIANAIRSKNGETTQYKPSEMAAAISAIETALEVLPQDTVSGPIANFPDGSNNYPVVELIADINPKQSGSGDPSPSNVRPISGSSSVVISVADENNIVQSTKTIDLGRTVYGGSLNVTTGVLTVISVRKKISDFGTWSYVTNYDGYFQALKGDMKEAVDNFTPLDGLYCEVYKTATSSAAGSGKVNYTIASGSGAAAGLRIRNNDYSDVQSFLAAFGNYYVVYPLETPQTYQLEPEEVKTLLGVNNIYADTGDVEVTYRADVDLYIAKKIGE